VSAGSVKQSFSHGRTNTVMVEKKRGAAKRPGEASSSDAVGRTAMVRGPEPGTSVNLGGRGRATSAVIRNLTNEERDARARALRGAVLEGERRDSEPLTPEIAIPIGGEAVATPMTRDALRQREMDELHRIQEQEKVDGERRRTEDAARGRDLQATRKGEASGRGASNMTAARLGGETVAKPGVAGLPGRRGAAEEDEEGGRGRKAGKAPPAPRRAMGDQRSYDGNAGPDG
jgi:translation initiation factor IF-2